MQTGNVQISIGCNQSTSPNVPMQKKGEGLFEMSGNIVFKIIDNSEVFTGFDSFNNEIYSKEELTKEEEDKFYEKAFKTSLL